MIYYVKIAEIYITNVEIKAESEKQALEIAGVCLNTGRCQNGNKLPDGIYDYTLDPEFWKVYKG